MCLHLSARSVQSCLKTSELLFFCLIPANFQLQQAKTGRWWKEAASKGLNMLFSGDLWSFWLIDHVMLLDWRPGWKTKMFKLQFRTTLRFTPVTLKKQTICVPEHFHLRVFFSINVKIKSLFHYQGGLRPNAIQVLCKYWCLSGTPQQHRTIWPTFHFYYRVREL